MLEIVLDTETTGLRPHEGHRVIEIGCVEIDNCIPTGREFHAYINPERDIPEDSQRIHGLSEAFLADKPVFGAVSEDFLAFIGAHRLVMHNAPFDMGFLDAEMKALGRVLTHEVVDTLELARAKFPGSANDLNALCRRFAIDTSKREKHGALLDAKLLAQVYLELCGGRAPGLSLRADTQESTPKAPTTPARAPRRGAPKAPTAPALLTEDEAAAHRALVKSLGPKALWRGVKSQKDIKRDTKRDSKKVDARGE